MNKGFFTFGELVFVSSILGVLCLIVINTTTSDPPSDLRFTATQPATQPASQPVPVGE